METAIEIYNQHMTDSLAMVGEIRRRIIEPNMERINKALGQENDATYLAYAIQFALNHAPRRS